MDMWSLVFALSAFAISLISLVISAWALIHYIAKDKSTHSIQYIPVDPMEAKPPAVTQTDEEMDNFESKKIEETFDNVH